MKLLHRLTIAFALLLLVVTGATVFMIHSLLLDNLIEQQKRELLLKGQLWIQQVHKEEGDYQQKDFDELARSVASNKQVEILLLGKRKKVLYTTLPSKSVEEWLADLERKGKRRSSNSIWKIGSSDYIVVAFSLNPQERQRLFLATPVRGLKEVRIELTEKILSILVIGAVCALILSFFITRSLVNPLSKLVRELRKVQRRSFSDVKLIPADGEIGEVTESVYYLAQELDRFHAVQKQFFQNASHELKTPLMSIQGYAEGIRDGIFTGEAARQGLDVIVQETSRLKSIVTEMILLAKLESEEDLFHPAPASVTQIVNRAIERLHPLAVERAITVSLRSETIEAVIDVDQEKFLQALLNILGNAVRYASECVEVKISSAQKQLLIEIIDDGPGIPEQLLPNLFHRFVKGWDGENGLGLAISRAIIERCGGSVSAHNGMVAGAVIQISFPAK